MSEESKPPEPTPAATPKKRGPYGKNAAKLLKEARRKPKKPKRHKLDRVGTIGNKAHLKYRKEFAEKAYHLALLEFTDENIAANLNVRPETVCAWKKSHKEFGKAIEDGRTGVAIKVGLKLVESACGYSHPDEVIQINTKTGTVHRAPTVKHYPPSVPAALAVLQAKLPDKWKNKTETHVTGDGTAAPQISIRIMSEELPAMKQAVVALEPAQAQLPAAKPQAPTIPADAPHIQAKAQGDPVPLGVSINVVEEELPVAAKPPSPAEAAEKAAQEVEAVAKRFSAS